MAGARRQARPQVRAGSRRGLLPHPVSLRRLVLLTLAMIGECLRFSWARCRSAASDVAVAERRVVKVIAAFVLAAVAAHGVVSYSLRAINGRAAPSCALLAASRRRRA